MLRTVRWGTVPIGLMMLFMTWMAWNLDNLDAGEQVVTGTVTEVRLNVPTVAYSDLSGQPQIVFGEVEDRPARIGTTREVVLTVDASAEPRLRNTNPRWLVNAFGLFAVLLVAGPFIQLAWRLLLGAGGVAAVAVLAKRSVQAFPNSGQPGSTNRSGGGIVDDAKALATAARDEYSDSPALKSAGKELAGTTLIAEGIVGIDNPFTSRNRGGIYSTLVGLLAAVGLILYAPIVGSLVTGAAGDVKVEAVIVDSHEVISEDDDGATQVFWQPVYEYADPATGSVYTFESSSSHKQQPSLGQIETVAFPANNPAAAIVVQPWGRWIRPGITALGLAIALASLIALAMRITALVLGIKLLRAGTAERRERGDHRPTLAVLRDAASGVIGRTEAQMPDGARGTVLSALVATRRQAKGDDVIRAAREVAGATILADSLFGLEKPFDGENTRLGIFGNALFVVMFGALVFLGGWVGNQLGYVGDRQVALGEVTEFVDDRAVVEYVDHLGERRSIVESDSGSRAVGNNVRVVFDEDAPELGVVSQRGAGAIRWLFIGSGVLGILGLLPTVLMQLAGVAAGLGLLVGFRRRPARHGPAHSGPARSGAAR